MKSKRRQVRRKGPGTKPALRNQAAQMTVIRIRICYRQRIAKNASSTLLARMYRIWYTAEVSGKLKSPADSENQGKRVPAVFYRTEAGSRFGNGSRGFQRMIGNASARTSRRWNSAGQSGCRFASRSATVSMKFARAWPRTELHACFSTSTKRGE